MVSKIKNLPENVLGFNLFGISKSDFSQLILPEIVTGIRKNPKLDFLYFFESDADSTFGDWFEDAIRKVQNLSCWNKTAFITDSETMNVHVRNFQKFMKGDYKIFRRNQENDAILWLTDQN